MVDVRVAGGPPPHELHRRWHHRLGTAAVAVALFAVCTGLPAAADAGHASPPGDVQTLAGGSGEADEVDGAAVGARRVTRRLGRSPGECGTPCPLQPGADTELKPGAHVYTSIDIPAGVTIHAAGPLTLHSNSTVNVGGSITVECGALEIRALGAVTILGALDNRCSGDSSEAGNLVIHTEGGNPITLGAPGAPAMLYSNGGLDVSNDSTLEDWEFDVLPFQRSAAPLPPVCSAFADAASGPGLEEAPFPVNFYGAGADPDGGPVTHEWDFGDGGTSTEQEPVHEFAADGIYDVTLTVTDDDGESCVATGRVAWHDDEPVVVMAPLALVVAAGDPITLSALGSPEASYAWDLGDGAQATGPEVEHTFAAAGRYMISVEADVGGEVAQASASVWVYHAAPQPAPASGSHVPLTSFLNVVAELDPDAGGSGGVHFRSSGNLTIGGDSDVSRAATASEASSRTLATRRFAAAARAMADLGSPAVAPSPSTPEKGVAGWKLVIEAFGTVVVQPGAHMTAGDGGPGVSVDLIWARDGSEPAEASDGGKGGDIVIAASTVVVGGPGPVTVVSLGNGGRGGDAESTVTPDSRTGCVAPSPPVSDAAAYGGKGGNGGRFRGRHAVLSASLVSLENVQIRGGRGGDGGDARATGGDGADSTCEGAAEGGRGAVARAAGGRGGKSFALPVQWTGVLADEALEGGIGGNAEVYGGDGGDATSEPTTPCTPAHATGGAGGSATVVGGEGGWSAGDGVWAPDGIGLAEAGDGGNAFATGTDCTKCESPAETTATGGIGAAASVFIHPGNHTGVDGAFATGGDGGSATALGGDGGPCTSCPGSSEGAGAGGPATAEGGRGGDAFRDEGSVGDTTAGKGGNATATGGNGGAGATCCEPAPSAGGKGGDGGKATVKPGVGGRGEHGGGGGAAGGHGGDAGDGGDGNGPGEPGASGDGPSPGMEGTPGSSCPPSLGEMGAWLLPVPSAGATSPAGFFALLSRFWALTENGLYYLATGHGPQSVTAASPSASLALELPMAGRITLPSIEPDVVVELDDGSTIVGGRTSSRGWLGRLMPDGSLAWQQKLDTVSLFRRMAQVDATTALAAFNELGTGKVSVTRVTSEGSVGPTVKLDSPTNSSISAVVPLADGGFLIAISVGSTAPSDTMLLRVDAAGAIVWQVRFGRVTPASLSESSGDIYLLGSYRAPEETTSDGWVARLASNGAVIWQRTYGDGGSVRMSRIIAGPSGLVAVARMSPGSAVRVLQLAADGTVTGARGYGSGFPEGAGLTADGGVAFATYDFSTGFTVIVTAADLTLPGCSDPALGAVIDTATIPTALADVAVSTPTMTSSSVGASSESTAATPSSESVTPIDLCAAP